MKFGQLVVMIQSIEQWFLITKNLMLAITFGKDQNIIAFGKYIDINTKSYGVGLLVIDPLGRNNRYYRTGFN